MADPTAKAICEMFGLDTSSIGTDEAASALALQAVNGLVTSYGELQAKASQAGILEDEDTEDEDTEDENTENLQDEDNEDEDTEHHQNDDNEEDNNDETLEDEEGRPVIPNNRQPANPKKKGSNMPIAASFPPALINGLARGRIAEINSLVSAGNITPAVGKRLVKKYASAETLNLALSMDEGQDDGFESTIDILRSNGPVIRLGEHSGNQSEFSGLGMVDGLMCDLEGDDVKDPKKNPLLVNAESRNAKK